MNPKLCLNTSTIKPQPLLEKIRLAGETGYDGIELWINDLYDHVGKGGEISDVEKALGDQGLMVPCCIAIRQWGDMDGWEYKLVLDEAKRRFELGARIGAPYIVATPPIENCDLSRLPARYADLLEIGRQTGIKPTFEYISFFKSIHTLRQAWEIVQQTDDPDATLILDAFHNWNSGSTMDDLQRIPVDKISHYHIDDAHPGKPKLSQTDPDRVMIGDGVIDLKKELSILRAKGYRGAMSLELFNQDLWAKDPREVLTLGLERMQALIEE
ncbi:sugar phosphate isomerase/epimerase [bacterium]|nr:sugar phosphate isomerase/epimerase [Verrucomicrobiota bacterium]MDC0268089.1 sugar phosphate isomerase/epimerase [bacterium]